MATAPDTSDDYVRRLNRESAQLEAETRRLRAEADKLLAERMKVAAAGSGWEDRWFSSPWAFALRCTVLALAIMSIGGVIAVLLSS